MSPSAVKRYAIACLLVLAFALIGCEGTLTPSSPPPSPLLPPSLSPSSTPTQESTPAPFREESPEELEQALAPTPTPTPSLFPSTFPDLTPPPGGWIAFLTSEGHLTLISSDASRFIPLTEQGEVTCLAWSPDGHWLAFTINLGDYRGGQLALISLENSRLIPLTRPDKVSGSLTWSQDSHHLVYLHSLEKGNRPVASGALRVLDIATRQAITVSTYSNTRPDKMAVLCPQPFPFPVLPVGEACFSRIVRLWDVQTREVLAEIYPASYYCDYLGLLKGKGIIFAKEETQKAGIESTCLQASQDCMKGETLIIHPTDLAVWRMGDEALTVLLEGTQKQHYDPTRWLPDGRLEVRVDHFEKTAYEGPARPEYATYRYFDVTGDGMLREAKSGDLPWWAAGGFQEAFKTTGLYQEQTRDRPLIPGWEVGPDGETVTFGWSRQVSEEQWESAIYLWQGEGEPMRLSMGECPRWQPEVTSLFPTPSPP